ncbi:MAG: hypothetical protein QGH13_00050 [Candidatus Thalassarchaeaceae archaeon]|nr:hypothetical protein [Candidatus Thalassarchaeaceae archaeon]
MGDVREVHAAQFRSIVIGVVIGVLIVRIGSLFFPIEIGGFLIHISLLGMVVLCVFSIELLSGMERLLENNLLVIFGVASGAIIDETLWLIVRNPPLVSDAPAQVAYWSTPSIVASLLGTGMLLTTTYFFSRNEMKRVSMLELNNKHNFWAGLILIGGLIFFHVSQEMIRYDIPNVERSLVILGYEIHHLVEGQFMLMLSILMMVFVGGKKWVWRSSYILTLVGVLFVADEILYYQLIEVSDDAYFELITIISGGVFVLLFLLQLIFQTKIRNKVD